MRVFVEDDAVGHCMLKRVEADLDYRRGPLPLRIRTQVDLVALKGALDNVFAHLLLWINGLLNSMLLLNFFKLLPGLNSLFFHPLVRVFIRQFLCLDRVLFLDWLRFYSV